MKPTRWWSLLAVFVLVVGVSPRAMAQAVEVQGRIERFTLSPNGLLDGFLLDDGTEVHVAAYLADQLAHAVHQGEKVHIQGQRVPSVRVIIAWSVKAELSGKAVVDSGQVGLGPSMALSGTPETSATGIVKQLLHGAQGQVNGALLDTGLIVRLPAGVPVTRLELFVVGQQMAVSGTQIDTEYGRVLRIDSMGASENELSPVRQPGLEPPEPLAN